MLRMSVMEAARPAPAKPEPRLPATELTARQVRLVFAGLMLALFLAALDQTIVATALPRIVGELHGLDRMSWVVTAYLLASTVVLPLYGKLGDIFGRARVFRFAIAIFIVGSALSGWCHSIDQLIAFRAVQGIGGGGLMIGVQSIIADIVSPRDRGRYMGLIGAVFGISSVAGPLLGGWFTDGPGWRWCFWVNIPIGALALLVTLLVLRLPRPTARPRLDLGGALLLAVASTCLVLATSWGGTTYAWTDPVIAALGAATVGCLVLFALVERFAAEPVIPLRLFRDGVFNVSGGIGVVVGVALFGAASYLPSFLQMVNGASATGSGLLMLPMMGGIVLASIGSGQLISRTGRYKAYPVLGGALSTAGMALLGLLLHADTPYVVSAAAMAVLGLGVGLSLPVLVLAVQNSVPPRDIGTATSANNYLRQIGGSVGAAVFGALFHARLTDRLAATLPPARPGGPALPDTDSITPELVRALPTPLRDAYVTAYADAMPRIFLYLVPVLALGFVLAFLLKEKPLATQPASGPAATPGDLGLPPQAPGPVPVSTPASASASTSASVSGAAPTYGTPAAPTGPAPGIPLRGTVREPDRGAVPNAVLTLIDMDGRQVARAASGASGSWALAAPRSGNYVLIAAAGGHQPQAVTVAVGSRPVDLDVVLGGTGRLSGAVRSTEGAPVLGAAVVLTDPRGEVVATGHTDDDGAYHFRDLVAGDYTLAVSARAYRPAALAVAVAPSGETRQDVALAGSGTLRGTVRTSGGHPVADARVTLLDSTGTVVAAVTTGADGTFRFSDLQPGEYTVIASGYPPVATALRLEDGHTERDLHLSHRLD
ncbi:MFS transporter [Peterkaempfera bronchialis]|uniref:alpha-amylase n=2 Tax=Peterkaempfera bronchialis TaxID=2126346 RepID=A0A345T6M5_9ACTN|nr:MFS transporter [Peterkaempfera bronchialis]